MNNMRGLTKLMNRTNLFKKKRNNGMMMATIIGVAASGAIALLSRGRGNQMSNQMVNKVHNIVEPIQQRITSSDLMKNMVPNR